MKQNDRDSLLQILGTFLMLAAIGLSSWSLAETYKHESKQAAQETKLHGLEASVKDLKADIIADLNEIKLDVKEIKKEVRK